MLVVAMNSVCAQLMEDSYDPDIYERSASGPADDGNLENFDSRVAGSRDFGHSLGGIHGAYQLGRYGGSKHILY